MLLHVIINAYWEALEFEIPALVELQKAWRRYLILISIRPTTFSAGPLPKAFEAQPRSMIVLLAKE